MVCQVPRVMRIPLILECNLPLRVRRIDPSDERSGALDLILRHRLRPSVATQHLDEQGLHLAFGRTSPLIVSGQKVPQRSGSIASRLREPVKRCLKGSARHEPTVLRPVERHLDDRQVTHGPEVEERSLCVRVCTSGDSMVLRRERKQLVVGGTIHAEELEHGGMTATPAAKVWRYLRTYRGPS
jgi:hypothetical protein